MEFVRGGGGGGCLTPSLCPMSREIRKIGRKNNLLVSGSDATLNCGSDDKLRLPQDFHIHFSPRGTAEQSRDRPAPARERCSRLDCRS